MYNYPVMPDEVKAIIDFLEGHSYVLAFNPIKVAGDLKGWEFPQRWISVQGTGGTYANPKRVAAPRVDVNIYAENKVVTKEIARHVAAALLSMKNHVSDQAVVIAVEPSTPADLTDPINSHPRFIVDATVYIRPI